MGYFKYGIATLAFILFAAPSIAEAQNFQTLGRRRGAVAGALLGAVIGDQNNEAFAGAAIGGLVGGTIGNVSGRNIDRQFHGGQPIYNYGGNNGYYSRPVVQQQQFYRPSQNYYRSHGGYGGHSRYGGRGW